MNDAEKIVRALAAVDGEDLEDFSDALCPLCGGAGHGTESLPQDHEAGCPWRLAREWVEANPR